MVSAENCSQQQKLTALERALRSRTFARSEQLRFFLQYVCEAEFRGAGSQLTEYVIGVDVLRRPKNYSPSEDSAVRTRAYELRHKLEKLYAEELPGEQIQIVIPKGGYVPQFLSATAPTKPDELPSVLPAVSSSRALSVWPHRTLWIFAAILLFVAVFAAITGAAVATLHRRVSIPESSTPSVLTEAWAPFAKHNGTVLLMAATPLFLVLGPDDRVSYGTATYPAPPEAYPLFRQHRPLAPNAKLGMIFTGDALGVGSLNAVVIASNVVHELGGTYQILPERANMMAVLHGRDTVLFGAPVDSQVIAEVLDKTPLSVVYDKGVKEFIIRDRFTGQAFISEKEPNGEFHSVYGLVTVLNTRESDRGRLGMVVFSGVTSVGTHGAAEYFASPRSLQALLERFNQQGIRSFPPAYQIVVKCRFENYELIASEYCAHRVIQRN